MLGLSCPLERVNISAHASRAWPCLTTCVVIVRADCWLQCRLSEWLEHLTVGRTALVSRCGVEALGSGRVCMYCE